jgi:hypothetical protein
VLELSGTNRICTEATEVLERRKKPISATTTDLKNGLPRHIVWHSPTCYGIAIIRGSCPCSGERQKRDVSAISKAFRAVSACYQFGFLIFSRRFGRASSVDFSILGGFIKGSIDERFRRRVGLGK